MAQRRARLPCPAYSLFCERPVRIVRGAGLFIGVDLVVDRETGEPAAQLARQVANGMREDGVLISLDGPGANVLEICPPLPFRQEHAHQLIESLASQLGALT